MKKWIYLSLLIAVALACDKIDDPLKDKPGTTPTNGDVVKKVLLEEFTGVRCNNCPAAGAHAQSLGKLYGDQLILVSIHAGDLAEPDSEHPVDFTTPEGDQFFDDFDLFGVPVGFVDRTGYDDQSLLKLKGQWGAAIEEQLQDPAKMKITISEEDYNGSTGKLDVKVSLEVVEDMANESYMLSVFLLEDGIIAPQTLADKSTDEDYEHHHVLRGSFNSAYGQEITTSGFAAGEKSEYSESITIKNSWMKSNCSVVAFVYRKSNFEVLQSEKLEL